MANAIDKFPVPLILKKILKDRMSGELIVLHDDSVREFFFVDGRLEFATTTVENECLGDVLLEAGKINKDQLRLALDIRSNVPTKIGEILAKTCDLTMRDIYDGLVKQVIKIAVALFPLKQGEWRFIKKNPKIQNAQNLKIKLPEIMREGVKRLDDFSFYKRKFYYRSPVTIDLPEKVANILADEETGFYEKLSRFTNISVRKIIPILQVQEPIFWRHIILFYLLNAVDFVEFTVDDEEKNKKIAEITDMYQKIQSGQSDYFQLLESDKIVTVAEANERFNEISDRFDPGKLNVAPDSTAMRRAREVLEEIRNAHTAVRLDIEKKSEQKKKPISAAPPEFKVDMDSEPPIELGIDEKIQQPPGLDGDMASEPSIETIIDEKIGQPSEIIADKGYEPPPKASIETKGLQADKPGARKADQVKQARELFTRANRLHNEKKYFEAASLLQKAVVMDSSKANYFLLLGLCQSKMPATKKLAEKNLKNAARMEPWNADPMFALGQLYKSENLTKKAKAYFEKALELNLDHTLAGKAMDEFIGMGDKKSLFSLFGKKK